MFRNKSNFFDLTSLSHRSALFLLFWSSPSLNNGLHITDALFQILLFSSWYYAELFLSRLGITFTHSFTGHIFYVPILRHYSAEHSMTSTLKIHVMIFNYFCLHSLALFSSNLPQICMIFFFSCLSYFIYPWPYQLYLNISCQLFSYWPSLPWLKWNIRFFLSPNWSIINIFYLNKNFLSLPRCWGKNSNSTFNLYLFLLTSNLSPNF